MPDIKNIVAALDLTQVEHTTLDLTFATGKVTTGQNIPKADAQAPPELSFYIATGTYIVIAFDPDAPFPSFNALSPLLHWMQSGLTPEKATDGTTKLSASGTPVICSYLAPTPPPLSASHRYIFLLYAQPDGFDFEKYAPAEGKPLGMWQRIRYDLAAFEKEAKLGPIIASNYFLSE